MSVSLIQTMEINPVGLSPVEKVGLALRKTEELKRLLSSIMGASEDEITPHVAQAIGELSGVRRALEKVK